MAPCTSTPSKPAASALAAPFLKLSMMPGISSSVSARGSDTSANVPFTKVLPLARIAEGATGAYFTTFVLLANPNDDPAAVTRWAHGRLALTVARLARTPVAPLIDEPVFRFKETAR